MATLSYLEKRNLEDFLEMHGGYVLDFSNRTFEEFIFDCTGKKIYDGAFSSFGSSKANHLRCFWDHEADHVVGKLLKDLIDWRQTESPLREKCRRIADRLLQSAAVQEAQVISVLSGREEFERLAKGVQDAIEKNEPESGLDRLHTFTVKFTRSLCEKHGITVERDKPLHSITAVRGNFRSEGASIVDSD